MRLLFLALMNVAYANAAFSQLGDYGLMENSRLITKNRVKEIKTYYYDGKKDSSLYYIHLYDTSGKLLSKTQYTPKGAVSSSDTLFYDTNNRLLKRWAYSSYSKGIDEYLYAYDSNGVFIRQVLYSNDTLMFYSLPKFDKEGKAIGGKIVDGKADTLTMETFSIYDSLGRQRKFVVKYNNGDSSVTVKDYDSLGNIIRNQSTSTKEPQRINTYTYQYNSTCGYTLMKSSDGITGKLLSTSRKSYLPNCLVYENELVIFGAPGRYRSYYNYYKE